MNSGREKTNGTIAERTRRGMAIAGKKTACLKASNHRRELQALFPIHIVVSERGKKEGKKKYNKAPKEHHPFLSEEVDGKQTARETGKQTAQERGGKVRIQRD